MGPRPSGNDSRDPRALALSFRDVVQIVYTFLFVILGAIILVRAHRLGGSVPGIAVGGGLVAFGLYRLRFIIGYYLRRRRGARSDG
jgi:hypothetical protein